MPRNSFHPPRKTIIAHASKAIIDEEKIPGYNSELYYPANPSDVLEDRYRLIAKLGWGASSTAWLALDTRSGGWFRHKKYVVMKLCNCDPTEGSHELDILHRLSCPSPQYSGQGRSALATATDAYTIQSSPHGREFLAIVYEPLREPLWLFKRRILHKGRVSRAALSLIKVYTQVLLQRLDYMHSEAQVVHTGMSS
ncbi:hypothetical protein E4U21_007030 [Claviceps maximensis]|nr:hypothetical protein E4U21_007030 [Claviceps maximensis]